MGTIVKDSFWNRSKPELSAVKPTAIDYKSLDIKLLDGLPLSFAYYQGILKATNPAMFPFLSDEEQERLLRDLQIYYRLLIAKRFEEKAIQRKYNEKSLESQRKLCEDLIDRLTRQIEDSSFLENISPDSPTHYLSLFFGLWLGKKLEDFLDYVKNAAEDVSKAKTKTFVELLSMTNERRLFWVWGRSLETWLILALSNNFIYKQQALQEISMPARSMGYISWVLYYVRFGVQLALLLKHTTGWWLNPENCGLLRMAELPDQDTLGALTDSQYILTNTDVYYYSKYKGVLQKIELDDFNRNQLNRQFIDDDIEQLTLQQLDQIKLITGYSHPNELNTTWTERLKSQWDQRKFRLLNDSLWGSANLVCFYWLVGPKALNSGANLLTVCLLMFDLSVAVWAYLEAKSKYQKELNIFEEELERLRALRDLAKTREEKRAYEISISNLEEDIKQYKTNWSLEEYSKINDIAYTAVLLIAVAVMTAPFLPVSAPILMILGIAGAAASFAFTVIYSGIHDGIEIGKTRNARSNLNDKRDKLFQKFLASNDLDECKKLYIQINDLDEDLKYHSALIRCQSLKLVRSILIDALMPALVFAGTVFMPLGIGIPIILAGFLIEGLSKLLLDKIATPDETKKTEFTSEGYDDFLLFSKKDPSKIIDQRGEMDKLDDLDQSLILP